MNQVVTLLAELFLIGCLHMIISMCIDLEKKPAFARIFAIACIVGSLFLIARFVISNLIPQMGSIFRLLL